MHSIRRSVSRLSGSYGSLRVIHTSQQVVPVVPAYVAKMSKIATASSLDHLVLTVKDLDASVSFYEKYLGMKHASFTSGGVERHALSFGRQKINLHVHGKEFEPKAEHIQPGSGDLCFLVEDNVDEVLTRLKTDGIEILEDGQVVNRTGARAKLRSVYIRDPDGNLIVYECPKLVDVPAEADPSRLSNMD